MTNFIFKKIKIKNNVRSFQIGFLNIEQVRNCVFSHSSRYVVVYNPNQLISARGRLFDCKSMCSKFEPTLASGCSQNHTHQNMFQSQQFYQNIRSSQKSEFHIVDCTPGVLHPQSKHTQCVLHTQSVLQHAIESSTVADVALVYYHCLYIDTQCSLNIVFLTSIKYY